MNEKYFSNIHDYQPQVIRIYRDNPKITEHEKSLLLEGNPMFLGQDGKMQLCYSADAPILCDKRDYVCRVENGEERLETVYDIDTVFDRERYSTAKRYQDKVKRWLNYFEKHNFEIRKLTEADLDSINLLYKKWYEVKNLDDFMILRYRNCILDALNTDYKDTTIIGMFDENKKLVGFRTLALREDRWAFDLSNSCSRDEDDYKYLSEIFQVNSLKWLRDNMNVKYYNLGLSDGSLRLHKTLLPNFDIHYYVVR